VLASLEKLAIPPPCLVARLLGPGLHTVSGTADACDLDRTTPLGQEFNLRVVRPGFIWTVPEMPRFVNDDRREL
jgi:hypothetical protein